MVPYGRTAQLRRQACRAVRGAPSPPDSHRRSCQINRGGHVGEYIEPEIVLALQQAQGSRRATAQL